MSFAQGHISVDQVQQLLGIADEGRLLQLSEALASCDALQVIQLVDEAARNGADAGQLAEQLLNYFRDLMAVGIGGGPELLKLANPAGHSKLQEITQRWGVQSILSAIQILDETLVRMRSSVAASALLEVALVQICQLSQLASIPALLEAVTEGVAGRTAGNPTKNQAVTPPSERSGGRLEPKDEKKNIEPAALASSQPVPRTSSVPNSGQSHSSQLGSADTPHGVATMTVEPVAAPTSSPVVASDGKPLDISTDALQLWRTALNSISDMLADYAGLAVAVAPTGSDQWNVVFPPGNVRPREVCEQSERRQALEVAVEKVVHRRVRLTFSVMPGEAPRPTAVVQPSNNRVQKMREVSENPYVKKLCEAIDGEILRVDPPQQTSASRMDNLAQRQKT